MYANILLLWIQASFPYCVPGMRLMAGCIINGNEVLVFCKTFPFFSPRILPTWMPIHPSKWWCHCRQVNVRGRRGERGERRERGGRRKEGKRKRGREEKGGEGR